MQMALQPVQSLKYKAKSVASESLKVSKAKRALDEAFRLSRLPDMARIAICICTLSSSYLWHIKLQATLLFGMFCTL